jgi:hypothetical protein
MFGDNILVPSSRVKKSKKKESLGNLVLNIDPWLTLVNMANNVQD